MRRLVTVLGVSLAAGLAQPAPGVAQESATLERVEALARYGRTPEARALLDRWWSEASGTAQRRELQHGLWLRGRLAPDAAAAQLSFRRLVTEFPGGPYSDRALLRLAQLAHASGDSTGAVELVRRLGREHPGSGAHRSGEAWLAEAGPVPPPPAAAADPPPTGGAAAPPTAGAASMAYTLQIGAFSDPARARAVHGQATDAGFDARLVTVEGSGLIRVRVGAFSSRADAEAVRSRLAAAGFPVTLSEDLDRERPIGG